jgi:hypothetical protein
MNKTSDAFELALARTVEPVQQTGAELRTPPSKEGDLQVPLLANQILSPAGEVWEVLDDTDFDWSLVSEEEERAAINAFFGTAK